MDEDGNGTLNVAEFEKGMNAVKLCYLTPKAIKHLFAYFGR
jgi:hypothetical protein